MPTLPTHSQNTSNPYPNDLTGFITKHEPDELVGRGGYAFVYKCTLKQEDQSVDVAVKAFRALSDIEKEDLRREIGIWKRLRHHCIVSLLGTTTHYSPMSIVSSWMPNGTLHSYLKQDDVQKSPMKKYDLLYNIADGLNYLHLKFVVHGDLTSDNVLIDKNGQACLTDFGLSSMAKPGKRFQYLRLDGKQPGNQCCAAPELIDIEDNEIYVPSPSSDIYSYGCIIYEVLSGGLVPSLGVREALNGKTPGRPDAQHIHDEDWIFVLQCWLSLPSLRPSAPQALSFARTRLSLSQDYAESHGTLNLASAYSAHLEGANICNLSSLIRPHPRPAFSDPAICWKSIDKLAEALISLFTSKRYRHGLDDAIQLYHVSLATLMPSLRCTIPSLDKIVRAIPPITTEQNDFNVPSPIACIMVTLLGIAKSTPGPDLDFFSEVKDCYRQSFRNTTGDILSRLQISLACARVFEDIKQAVFGLEARGRISEDIEQAALSLEAYETSLQLVQSYILSATSTTAWAEPVEYFSTGIAADAAAAALRVGDVGGAVELLEWGRELLRMHIQPDISEGCPRPLFSDLLKATQRGPVVMLLAGRRSYDAIIVSNARHQAIHVPLEAISLNSLAELSATFHSCISSVPGNSETIEKGLRDILRRLWVEIVEPVMNRLKPEDVPESRIWWCLTSAFFTLPIHAAGIYTPEGRRLSRHYVSSYTSSINSLLQTQRTCTDHPKAGFASIYVSKPHQKDEKKEDEYPVIKSPGLEPGLVMDNLPASLRSRRYREVTYRDALKAFKDHGWFHLMAYASRTASEPHNPSLLMRDRSLSISDIIKAKVGPKEFAFLSPRPVESRFSWMQEEVVQFAAGLQISGFKSMVGMMDGIGDFKVIDKFYRTLFRTVPPNCTQAAQVLHDTLEGMANSAGLSLRQRIAFAHFGV